MTGRVLIHCISGVSRATTIVLLYIMTEHKMNLKDCFQYVYSCRPWVAPNTGFLIQLIDKEIELYGCTSVSDSNTCHPIFNFYEWNKRKYLVDIMKMSQSLNQIIASVVVELKAVLDDVRPDIVLVHGDTSTAMVSSLAAFYLQIPIGHVEAGLRTFDIRSPFPEEIKLSKNTNKNIEVEWLSY